MTQLDLIDVGHKPLGQATMSRVEFLLAIADRQHINISSSCGICEPGYDDTPAVFADWNNRTQYDRTTNSSLLLDDTPSRLAKLFEKLGFSVQWEDEWTTCDDCGKAFRTSPDSYSWTLAGVISDSFCQCEDCVLKNPDDYLESLVGNEDRALTLSIDPEEYGYHLYKGGFANGFHPDQKDSPHKIASELRKQGIQDFIFVIDSKGQFDIHFSVWIKNDEDEDEDE